MLSNHLMPPRAVNRRPYLVLNTAVSANAFACCGVSERIGNIIIPCGSKILRSFTNRTTPNPRQRGTAGLLRRVSNYIDLHDLFSYTPRTQREL